MRKNTLVYLLLMLLSISSCRALREGDIANSRKEDCSRFIYCPATLVLLKGDTIRGRFTMASGIFFQVHENNDSNTNRTGKENGVKDSYYPVSTWYKRFTPEEINSFTANGQTFETVIHVADKNGNDMPWNSNNIFYLPRLTPDSSQIRLYRSFTPHSHEDTKITKWYDLLGEIISDMVAPGYYTYYIHFPGETPHKVWMISLSPEGLAAKTKTADLFSTCPELQSLSVQIKGSSDKEDLIHSMLSKEELKSARTLPAILAILRKYDECSYHTKN